MMYTRGNKEDYDNWEKQNPGWGYREMLKYYKKSENNLQIDKVDKSYHGTGGVMPVSYFPSHPKFADALMKGASELGNKRMNKFNSTLFFFKFHKI